MYECTLKTLKLFINEFLKIYSFFKKINFLNLVRGKIDSGCIYLLESIISITGMGAGPQQRNWSRGHEKETGPEA